MFFVTFIVEHTVYRCITCTAKICGHYIILWGQTLEFLSFLIRRSTIVLSFDYNVLIIIKGIRSVDFSSLSATRGEPWSLQTVFQTKRTDQLFNPVYKDSVN